LIEQRDHAADRRIVKPSIGNVFLHRSVYLHDGVYHVDAIHVFPGLAPKIYPGGEVAAYKLRDIDRVPSDSSRLAKDVARFDRLSDGFLGQHPESVDVIGDVRVRDAALLDRSVMGYSNQPRPTGSSRGVC